MSHHFVPPGAPCVAATTGTRSKHGRNVDLESLRDQVVDCL